MFMHHAISNTGSKYSSLNQITRSSTRRHSSRDQFLMQSIPHILLSLAHKNTHGVTIYIVTFKNWG